jgi:serine/threonine protein kinase
MSSLLSPLGTQKDDLAVSRGAAFGTAEHPPMELTGLVNAAGRRLPLLPPENLLFDRFLGRGSNSLVSREIYIKSRDPDPTRKWTPYYVAVKHIPSERMTRPEFQQRCDGLTKELRVMTHANLREHECIIPALAYGWTENPLDFARPYLVVEYSDHGTLTEYLQRIQPSCDLRRELALDVAVGLQALHQSKIIHGDIKPDNVLVCDCEDVWRGQSARLSDFGAAIFESDGQRASYAGTTLYKAPDILFDSANYSSHEAIYAVYYSADIYSFGLTTWEIMMNGKGFICTDWLESDESPRTFLSRLYQSVTDGLLSRAEEFCRGPAFKGATDLQEALLSTFRLTLRNDWRARSEISEVVKALSSGTT